MNRFSLNGYHGLNWNGVMAVAKGYKLLSEVFVSSATTSIVLDGSVDGWELDESKMYAVQAEQNVVASGAMEMFVGTDLTSANYSTQLFYSSGSSNSQSGDTNNAYFLNGTSGNRTSCLSVLKHTNSGYFTWLSSIVQDYDGTPKIRQYGGMKNSTVTTVDKLTFSAGTNGIGIGSVFRLYEVTPAYEELDVGKGIIDTSTQTITFDGFTVGKDEDLLIETDLVNGSSSQSILSIYANGDTTEANYNKQSMNSLGISTSGSRTDNAYYMYADGSSYSYSTSKIKLSNNGYFSVNSEGMRVSSSIDIHRFANSTDSTLTNITSVTITSNVTNGIGAGSRIRLYKRKVKTVADVTQTVASNYIDLTGLDIQKGDMYSLVASVKNDGTSFAQIKLFINNNYTDSNYKAQRTRSSGTSISNSAETTPFTAGVSSPYESVFKANINVTNDDYMTYISKNNRNVDGSIEVEMCVGNSTFTASGGISSIRIASSVTNGIGVGTRVQLIKWT